MALNANALTTLAMAKSHLGVTAGDTTQDARVELFINAASQVIETYCDRKFHSQTFTEFQHGRRSNMILLKQYPVTAIASVRIDRDHVFTDSNTLLEATEYSITDDESGIVLYTRQFPLGYNNVKVVYTAGFATGRTELTQLELACLWLVEWYYMHRSRGDMGRTSKSKGDESTGIMDDVPPMIVSILEPFKRFQVPGSNAPVFNT